MTGLHTLLMSAGPSLGNHFAAGVAAILSVFAFAAATSLLGMGEWLWFRKKGRLPLSWWGMGLARLAVSVPLLATVTATCGLMAEYAPRFSEDRQTAKVLSLGVFFAVFALNLLVWMRVSDGWIHRLAGGKPDGVNGAPWPRRGSFRTVNLAIMLLAVSPFILIAIKEL